MPSEHLSKFAGSECLVSAGLALLRTAGRVPAENKSARNEERGESEHPSDWLGILPRNLAPRFGHVHHYRDDRHDTDKTPEGD